MNNNIINQIYWERYNNAASIHQFNPDIIEVRITTIITGYDPNSIVLTPASKYMLRVNCPNIGCDNGYIDLSDEVLSAVKSGSINEGRKRCTGHLKKYNHNPSPAFNCETYVQYKIEPILKDKSKMQ